MDEPSAEGPDALPGGLHAEALELVRAVTAWVEWQEEAGSAGFPRAPRSAEPAAARVVAASEPTPSREEAQRAPVVAPAGVARAEPSPEGDRFPMPRFERTAPAPSAPAPTAPVVERVPVTPEERERRLSVLQATVQSCTRCGLHTERTQTVFARGNPGAELCFVGEGPGFDEDREGFPFVGKAGQLLDKMILAMGLDREADVYVANVVKCRPPNNRTPEAAEMASCLPFLAEQLELVRPKVIVALGSTALRGLLGTSDGITKVRGSWRLYRASIPVMPTFHPAYVLRQPTKEIRGMVWSDLQQVLQRLGRPVKPAARSSDE